MINNLEQIKKLLEFPNEDIFYHLQILKRKKEHPELGSNSSVVKTYYISSLEYLDRKMPEIINLCTFHKARAYINLNKRSYEKSAFHMLKKITDQIMNKDFKSVKKAYDSVCGMYSDANGDKKWIVDIDVKTEDIILKTIDILNHISPNCIIDKIETLQGFHLITKPFNKDAFWKATSNAISVHNNNPTILFIP